MKTDNIAVISPYSKQVQLIRTGCVVNAEDTKSADEKLLEAARLQKRKSPTNYDEKTDLFLNDLFDEYGDLFGQYRAQL